MAFFLPVGLIAYLLRLLGLGTFISPGLCAIARFWARMAILGAGVRLKVEGEENIPASGGVCFIGNHQGDFDILIALALIRRPFGFTAKREAAYVPIAGMWVKLLGGVFIDRGSPRKSFRAIEAGARKMREGGAMIIFPEGTRSRGREMLPFKPGAFKLATMAGAAIVPVAIDGSWKVWEESMRIRGADIVVRFGKPVPTEGLTIEARRALPAAIKAEIMGMAKLPAAAEGKA
ncbi:MAG: hypothetical protein A2Z99_10345 [Treponema sp. GWB1_62_6]|nr:MAG: hypothetical protein A2Z99_10345 [Treponema sp. GWB1_62_6]OHE67052.1 MAG: hypothetical protein A2001_08090 [Treponema sp. GWC1_61_84]OHE70944.1 MAG: hypothetical protein A2413_13285 [Treponema sp. RIFOXYC1_FULL_61_9]